MFLFISIFSATQNVLISSKNKTDVSLCKGKGFSFFLLFCVFWFLL